MIRAAVRQDARNQKMKRLDVKTAKAFLEEAHKKNPTGLWYQHCLWTAKAARAIAPHIGLDPDLAEAYAYVHDIGRMQGPATKLSHIYIGYKYLMEKGYKEAASICLTHSFPAHTVDVRQDITDLTKEEYGFVKLFIENHKFTQMDKVIQFSDVISVHSGFVVLERRLVDAGIRYGMHEGTFRNWQAFREIQAEFEEKIGKSIYTVLPEPEKIFFAKLKDTVVF